jgi:hypothetical protein
MKKSELKQLIRKILNEQVGAYTGPVGLTQAIPTSTNQPTGGGVQINSADQALQMAQQHGAPNDVVAGLSQMAQKPASQAMIAKKILRSNGLMSGRPGGRPGGGMAKKPFWDTKFGKLLFIFLAGAAGAAGGSLFEQNVHSNPSTHHTMAQGGSSSSGGTSSAQQSQMMALIKQGEKEYNSKRIPIPGWLKELIRIILSSGQGPQV